MEGGLDGLGPSGSNYLYPHLLSTKNMRFEESYFLEDPFSHVPGFLNLQALLGNGTLENLIKKAEEKNMLKRAKFHVSNIVACHKISQLFQMLVVWAIWVQK